MTIDITNGIRASALDEASEADASDSVVLISQNGTKKVAKRKFLSGYQSNDYSNTGRNLEVVYADEIANYSNVWAWIQARLDAHNVDDLKPGDYILVTLTSGEIVEMQIAGIDTHLNIFSGAVHTHIDWISRDCLATTHNWNTSNDNNGTSTEAQPFMASAVYAWLESEIYPKLPQAVRNVIKGKKLYMPTRYSASGKITDDNSWADKTFPHLWLPFEGEIFDHISWSTKGFGTVESTHEASGARRLICRLVDRFGVFGQRHARRACGHVRDEQLHQRGPCARGPRLLPYNGGSLIIEQAKT